MAANDGQQQRTRTSGGQSAPGSGRKSSANGVGEEMPIGLIAADLAFWSRPECTPDDRDKHLQRMNSLYQALVLELNQSGNRCVVRFEQLRARHHSWRWMVIIGTGAVAVINSLAALLAARGPGHGELVDPGVSLSLAAVAAVAAVGLTILANLENLGNNLERGHAYRDAREMYVTAVREANFLWETHVIPFWSRPEGCVNAALLYHRLHAKDVELRQKAKDLTQPRMANGKS